MQSYHRCWAPRSFTGSPDERRTPPFRIKSTCAARHDRVRQTQARFQRTKTPRPAEASATSTAHERRDGGFDAAGAMGDVLFLHRGLHPGEAAEDHRLVQVA